MFPEKSKFIQEAFYDATSKSHGNLIMDIKQTTPDELGSII